MMMVSINNNSSNEPATMSVAELANFLKISRASAYKLCHKENFPAIRINDKRILIIREQLWKWIDAQAKMPLEREA